MGEKYRMRCIPTMIWTTADGHSKITGEKPACGWTGVRTAYHFDCECYDIWTMYCRPLSPGPGCPSGIVWPCPKCGGSVTGVPVKHKKSGRTS